MWSFIAMLALGGLVTKSCTTFMTPRTVARQAPLYRIFQAWILEWVTISFSRGSSQSRDGTGSPALQADFLPTELPGKPKCENLGDTKSSIKQHFRNSHLWCYKSMYGTRSTQSVSPVDFNQTDYEKFTDMVFEFILQLVLF